MVASIALVPAAGEGRRFAGDEPKLWTRVAGRPVLLWTVERLYEAGLDRVVVALPPGQLPSLQDELDSLGRGIHCVAGGATRQQSVANALAAAPGAGDDLIVVHDGARPAVAQADVRRTVEAADLSGAALLGRPVTDTLKRLRGELVEETVPRHDLFRAETPQVFRRDLLQRALRQAADDGFVGSDEASAVERLPGVRVRVVAATRPNPKLTRVGDLAYLEFLLRQSMVEPVAS
ncbi:MAG: 2-C-methyl-D-erythritol 4-phosphate cytidylyltransferase [Thermoanaerobaculia bacterium]